MCAISSGLLQAVAADDSGWRLFLGSCDSWMICGGEWLRFVASAAWATAAVV